MIWAVLTITFYSITAYGDKYISAKLKCTPEEYTFLVSLVTVFWLVLCLPFTGWQLGINRYSIFFLACLVIWKALEFYTTAVLLKHMEPYELKAWLGINVILSYGINLWEGKSSLQVSILLSALCLLTGIGLIQPLQLFVLFVACLITGRQMDRRKRTGSILCVAAVLFMTVAMAL